MKRLIGILTVTVLLASCGNKMTLMKRHYTKGFYVEGTKAAQVPKTLATAKDVKLEEISAKRMSVSTEAATPLLSATIKSEINVAEANGPVHKSTLQAREETYLTKKSISFNHRLSSHRNALAEHKGGSGDANLILLVILSLFPFINLIAIYLHDGKKVTMNFWLDLILDCLFFFPGIIFALLVVLDVVNLG